MQASLKSTIINNPLLIYTVHDDGYEYIDANLPKDLIEDINVAYKCKTGDFDKFHSIQKFIESGIHNARLRCHRVGTRSFIINRLISDVYLVEFTIENMHFIPVSITFGYKLSTNTAYILETCGRENHLWEAMRYITHGVRTYKNADEWSKVYPY